MKNTHPKLQWAIPLGPEQAQMATLPSDYFSALSLSRNLSVGRLPADTGCPDILAMFHVYSLPEIPKSSCCPWSLCSLYLSSHNYTDVHACTHALVWHTHIQSGRKNHLVFAARLHILQILIDSSEVKEKGNLQSQKNDWDPKEKRTRNKLCATRQKADIRLSRTASKEQFNQVFYLLPLRRSVWVVSLFIASWAKVVLSYLCCCWNLNYGEKLPFYF